jgi:hypothetical protein
MEKEMADAVVHIGENSPEKVAYALMTDVFNAEYVQGGPKRTRKQILDTYAECLDTVRGRRDWTK